LTFQQQQCFFIKPELDQLWTKVNSGAFNDRLTGLLFDIPQRQSSDEKENGDGSNDRRNNNSIRTRQQL